MGRWDLLNRRWRRSARCERFELVEVLDRVRRFRNQPVLEIVDIARADPDAEEADPAHFLPTAPNGLTEEGRLLGHSARVVFRAYLLAGGERHAGSVRSCLWCAEHTRQAGALLSVSILAAVLNAHAMDNRLPLALVFSRPWQLLRSRSPRYRSHSASAS